MQYSKELLVWHPTLNKYESALAAWTSVNASVEIYYGFLTVAVYPMVLSCKNLNIVLHEIMMFLLG
ncbi:hypothetical protein A3E39_01300 [Candidatus Uhrbacteria bacterium RIFCSPHIGHO2_12_FULL_60_25]|uniref:Uncharacterized protein n=1 Tax=Candidatus Uhrbacteria bacterium RIFCSPHIGHO2_12_FULL_60_25 TaxID=1802399 RepID=A0A1F7UKG8_9BACT|nr:MAG: hypothetical protein A3D73_02185 [Candidatus Uhrbacteria bacterium RIFCSPHIGHO2_02_FULL_60_44]OGL78780.1 MAG: hypothetical protein A3E39_01300 [Candidatus Uhrbacteria bacterium RIFCSPHIGHO2_12_FULL_60_25]